MPRTLYLTHRSPYARKIAMVLHEKHLAFEEAEVDLQNRSAAFVGVSPIGKVPVLVDEDGTVVLDSTVICEYLEDRYPEVRLRGKGWEVRLAVRQVEELGDALSDQAVALYFAQQRGDELAAAKARAVIGRLLDALDQSADPEGGPFCGDFSYADASVLSAVGYLSLRHGDDWKEGRLRLSAWAARIEERESAVATRPRL